MGFIILCWVACAFQFLSIWAGIAKKDKKDSVGRKNLLHKLFCTMGIPAIVAFASTLIFLFVGRDYAWISILLLIILDVVMLYCGVNLSKKMFKNTNKR